MDANSFHRLAKVLADSGEAATLEDAHRQFSQYGVRIVLGSDAMQDPSNQIIALTAINTAARSFMGNVQVAMRDDVVLTAPGFAGTMLTAFFDWLGVSQIEHNAARKWPTIEVGSSLVANSIQPWARGWSFGIGAARPTGFVFPPACVAAGALAVSEAFSILRGDNPYAGRRNMVLSLWAPTSRGNQEGPQDVLRVPGHWMVGLGHLGQAYAWTIGFLEPANDTAVVLQDVDVITPSTLSTSVLSAASDLDQKKTRAVARWLENRGYKTAIAERRFDEHQRVGFGEPRIALFGVDNAAARRCVEGAGFRLVIDAGLGSGYRDFRGIRIRTFPGPCSAARLWADGDGVNVSSAQAPAYKALIARGAHPCGVTTLATRAVGAPFVGCVAAAFAVAELLRAQMGHPSRAYLDINLRDPEALEGDEVENQLCA